jgi:hypothetical protein
MHLLALGFSRKTMCFVFNNLLASFVPICCCEMPGCELAERSGWAAARVLESKVGRTDDGRTKRHGERLPLTGRLRATPEGHIILSEDVMGPWPATLHENARSALECGGSTPPWNRVTHKLKAAPSRRTPRRLRRTLSIGYFHGSEGSAFLYSDASTGFGRVGGVDAVGGEQYQVVFSNGVQ